MKYFTISRCEDEPYFGVFKDKESLARVLKDEYDGYEFLTQCGNLEDFPSKSILIIKGDVIIPKAKQKVTEWEL